jgi:hypothetical protein
MEGSGMHDREHLLARMDASHERICAEQRTLFELIAEADHSQLWELDGARDMAHWLWMRYGLSDWKARRWIAAAHALRLLPRIAAALSAGVLGVDKVVELCRFATPESESGLISWAERVSSGAIRARADRDAQSLRDVRDAESDRRLGWWYHQNGTRFALEADLPAAAGAVVARALRRAAARIPAMPGEEGETGVEARQADALVMLASARIASDADPDRSTLVVHVSQQALESGEGGAEIEGETVIHAETARRLGCSARIQVMLEDRHGQPIKLGRLSREPSDAMMRALRYRDRECRFPGCGARRYTHAHHVRWWTRGGPTDLDNLLLLCGFHHRLVHEHGWRVRLLADGTATWFRPGGAAYRPGPGADGTAPAFAGASRVRTPPVGHVPARRPPAASLRM